MNNAFYKQLLSGMDSIVEKFGSKSAKATLNQLDAMIQSDPEGLARSFFRAAFVDRPKLRSWYRDNVEMLRGAACDQYPAISTYDLDATLGRLHANLYEYDGPTRKRAFLQWATEQVKRQAARLEAFHRLQSEHSKVAYEAIWSVLRGSTDLGYNKKLTVPEIMSGVWRKVWKELDSLLEPGHRAKPGTRIYAMARFEARGWKKDQLRLRGVDDSLSKMQQEGLVSNKPGRVVLPNLDAIEHPEPELGEEPEELEAA